MGYGDGLTLCLNINFPTVIIELDAKAVINVISNPNQPNSIISSNVNDCRHLASRIPQTRFSHYFREANRCANHLAKWGTHQSLGLIMYDSPPMDLEKYHSFEFSGL